MTVSNLEELAQHLSREFGILLSGEEDYTEGSADELGIYIGYSSHGNEDILTGENLHLTKKNPYTRHGEDLSFEKVDAGFRITYMTLDINLATLRFADTSSYCDFLLMVLERASRTAKDDENKLPKGYHGMIIEDRIYETLDEASNVIKFFVEEFNKPNLLTTKPETCVN